MVKQASRIPGKARAAALAESLTRAVRRMESHLGGLADSILHGDRLSGFTGRGMEAAGVREYQAGDEARGIDWRVTARKGRLHVREFDEERDLPTLVCVHRSETLRGGRGGIREVRALEVAGLVAALALRSGDRVGLLQSGDMAQPFLSPSRSKTQLPMILSHLLASVPPSRDPGMGTLLQAALRMARERTRIFLIGDFHLRSEEMQELGGRLAELGSRHNLIPVRILDREEAVFVGGGCIPLVDPRDGRILYKTRESRGGMELREGLDEEEAVVEELFRSLGLREWRLDVADLLVPTIQRAMARARRGGGVHV